MIIDHPKRPLVGSATSEDSLFRSWLHYILFRHLGPTLETGVRSGKVEPEDLPSLFSHMEPDSLWRRYRESAQFGCFGLGRGVRMLIRVMILSQPKTFLSLATLNTLMQLGQMARPLVMQTLLATDDAWQGMAYVSVLVALQLFHVVASEHWFYEAEKNGTSMRTILMMGVYRSGLLAAAGASDAGRLTNLMATDADRVAGAHVGLRITNWTLNTLRLPYTIYMLHRLLGSAGFVGVVAVVAVHVASNLLGSCMAASMEGIQAARDAKSALGNRVTHPPYTRASHRLTLPIPALATCPFLFIYASHLRLSLHFCGLTFASRCRAATAMLKGFRLIRMHGCEDQWRRKIEAARESELKRTVEYRLINTAASLVNTLLSVSVPLSIFTWCARQLQSSCPQPRSRLPLTPLSRSLSLSLLRASQPACSPRPAPFIRKGTLWFSTRPSSPPSPSPLSPG